MSSISPHFLQILAFCPSSRIFIPTLVGDEHFSQTSITFELWIGDAAEIRTKRVRKQKTDRQDAQLILKLMLKDDFPRIWVPSWENRDTTALEPCSEAGSIG
jgi:hypothetical protein